MSDQKRNPKGRRVPGRDAEQQEIKIYVGSIVSHRTGEGIVTFHLSDIEHQFTTAKAREIALMLLEAAEAADQDANLIAWAREAGMDEQTGAQLLMALRQSRERRTGRAPRTA